MKKLLYLLPALFLLAYLTSCDDGTGDDPKDDEPAFTAKTVEENKQVVENSAIQMADAMGDMKDLETVDVAVNLGNILDSSDPFESMTKKKSKFSSTIHVIAGLQTGENSLHDLFTVMKSAGELDDPESIQEVWDEIKGTYAWNPATEEWDKTEGGDIATFQFPSSESATSNDAAFTISEYKGVVIAGNVLEDDYSGDFPTSLKADLKVGSTKLIDFTFAASYNSDGNPSMVASDLMIEAFTFAVDITNNESEVSASYVMKDGETTVMDMGGSAKGTFTQEAVDNNIITHTSTYTWTDYRWNEVTQTYEEVQITETDEWEELEIEEVVNSASAHFQLFDISLQGTVDAKSLGDEIRTIYPDDEPEDFDEQAAATAEAAAINKYVELKAVNVSANEIIAVAEAYPVHRVDEWDDYWYTDLRLKFSDDSTIDMETYIDQGFEDFVAEINTMIRELNSEYDWDLEEIDY